MDSMFMNLAIIPMVKFQNRACRRNNYYSPNIQDIFEIGCFPYGGGGGGGINHLQKFFFLLFGLSSHQPKFTILLF